MKIFMFYMRRMSAMAFMLFLVVPVFATGFACDWLQRKLMRPVQNLITLAYRIADRSDGPSGPDGFKDSWV